MGRHRSQCQGSLLDLGPRSRHELLQSDRCRPSHLSVGLRLSLQGGAGSPGGLRTSIAVTAGGVGSLRKGHGPVAMLEASWGQ